MGTKSMKLKLLLVPAAALLMPRPFAFLPALSGMVRAQLPGPVVAESLDLEPVPFPNLSAMEESVRKQLEHFQAELKALSQNPGTPSKQLAQAYGRMGKLYQTYDLLEAGGACYRNARQLAPQDFRWPYYLALLYEAEGDFEKSSDHYEKALTLQPNDLAAVLGVARAELDRGRPEAAQKRFEQAMELDPASAAALVGQGEIAAAARDFEQAVDHYEKALKLQPKASSIHYPLAMAYRQLGEVDKARLHLSRKGDGPVTFRDPLLEELARAKTGRWRQRQRANGFFDAGKHEEAARIFRQMVAEDPTDAVALMDLGVSLSQLGQVEEALEQFNAALRYSDSKSRIHFQMAVAFTQLGWEKQASEHYRSAVETDPTFREAHFQLANVLMRQELFEEAIPHYRRVVELDPSNAFARFMEAMTLVRTRRWKEAYTWLEEGLAALPDDTDLGHALARLLAACPEPGIRDGQRALKVLQEVLQKGKSAEFEQIETLAMVYAEMGHFDRAIQVQRMMIAEVTRGKRLELARLLQVNLARYEQREPCRTPWRDDDPVFYLAPVPFTLLSIQ